MPSAVLVADAPKTRTTPTIKGLFVNSHVHALERSLGRAGVAALEQRVGHSVVYGDAEDVPVADEVQIIETTLQLLSPRDWTRRELEYEAGRLHFQNFVTTPLARMVFTLFPTNFRYLMLHAKTIAERVFKGVKFTSTELGPKAIKVVMENNDYPIDHFRGLFQAWMDHCGLDGRVVASRTRDDRFEYVAQWR